MGLKKTALAELTPQVVVPKKENRSLKKYAATMLKKQDSKSVPPKPPKFSLAEVRFIEV
jgi:hypothetical protein